MHWVKPTEETVDLFHSLVPNDPSIEHRKMFGFPCCFINRNMFIGVHNNSIILRLSEKDRGEFVEKHGATIFEPMPGRPMKEYCLVPEDLLEDKEFMDSWVAKSIAYAKSLPPKPAKKKPV